MSVPRWLQPSVLGPVAVALLFLLPNPLVASTSAHPSGADPLAGGACTGARIDDRYSGTFAVEGGPRASENLTNTSLAVEYTYETSWVDRANGTVLSSACTGVDVSVLTNSTGGFAFGLSVPGTSCSEELGVCGERSGPFGPLAVVPSTPAPPGYVSTTVVNGSGVAVRLVAELGSVELDPEGPVAAYSPSSWETIDAEALAGNGSASPVTPEYNWTLAGAGWSFLSSGTGPSVNLSASSSAGLGELWVAARWSTGNSTFVAGPANLTLEAIPTSVVTANENRTAVDVGGSIAVTVTASGAPGYSYSTDVRPGLGLPARPLACDAQPAESTAEVLLCSGNVTYPVAGEADPSVVVSNGYSSATSSLPAVSASPGPALSLAPAAPYGYVGLPAPVHLSAAAGTGTTPYQDACLASGEGSVTCLDSPGPNWTFDPVYASPGTYLGSAWAVDAAGTNVSVAVAVVIAAPLALSPISGIPSTVVVGQDVEVAATLAGGFAPGQYWWNVSGDEVPIATGAFDAAGELATAWVPETPGLVSVSLAVVDAHGASIHESVLVAVSVDPARTVTAVEIPSADPVMAGSPVGLAWQAWNELGSPAVSFGSTAELRLTGPDGAPPVNAWANVSGIGPLAAVAPGLFGVPSGAWNLGRLNLSVTTTAAGALTVALVDLPGVTAPPAVSVAVGADLAHLELYAPEVVLAGSRTNATFWHLRDQYGNPAPGASLEVEFSSATFAEDAVIPALAGPGDTSGLWVNYSAPTSAGGSVEVRAPASGLVLLSLLIPAAPAATASASSLGIITAAGATIAVVGTALGIRSRRRANAVRRTELSEEELAGFVKGRDRVIAAVRDAGVADLGQIESAWTGGPAPPELSDWLASLVADGTLGARTGPDGVARFCLSGSALGPARVIVDEGALDRAARARAELLEDPEESDR